MSNEFGLKELYDLTLKTTYPIEINGRQFQEGEVIVRFDKIQLANFKEVTSRTQATGGFDNRALIIWEDPKEIQLNFTQGVFSKTQLALLSNSKLINKQQSEQIEIPVHLFTESDEQGQIMLGKEEIDKVFIYNAKTFEKIVPKSIDKKKGILIINQPYCDVEIDYVYYYSNSVSILTVGQKLIQGYLRLEGKTRVKDDITGKTRTAILRIPRLKLVSDLSMRLGREATPLLANFNAIGLPVGNKGDKKIMELFFLDDDIDAEM